MNPKKETVGIRYEIFINRARKFDNRIRRGHKMELINLMNAESGLIYSWQPNRERQLKNLKNRLIKACEIFIHKKFFDKTYKNRLFKNAMKIRSAYSSEELIPIIDSCLSITRD